MKRRERCARLWILASLASLALLLVTGCIAVPGPWNSGSVQKKVPVDATTPTIQAPEDLLDITAEEMGPGYESEDSAHRLPEDAAPAALDLLALRAQFLADTGDNRASDRVAVTALSVDTADLWAVHTIGGVYFDDDIRPHLLAIYARDPEGWRQMGLQEVGEDVAGGAVRRPTAILPLGADYLGDGSVTQVRVVPDQVWLQVDAQVGMNSSTTHIYSFDSGRFILEATHFSFHHPSVRVEDITGDGFGEVLLDASDSYVFCGACGVTYAHTRVLRWNGEALAPVELSLLPRTLPPRLVALNNRAVRQAQAGLWRDALDTVGLLERDASLDLSEAAAWNVLLITLNAKEKAPRGEVDQFPILNQVFYGDYAEAVALLRGYTAAQLFGSSSQPLLDNPVAQRWEHSIRRWVFNLSDAVLVSGLVTDEILAAAHFLRAWAAHVADSADPVVRENLARSAALAPDDLLYISAEEMVRGHGSDQETEIPPATGTVHRDQLRDGALDPDMVFVRGRTYMDSSSFASMVFDGCRYNCTRISGLSKDASLGIGIGP